MVRCVVGNNLSRNSVIVDENSTLRKVLEDNNIDYSIGMTSLDGSTLAPGDLDKTFADFGITEKCYLMNVVKADNAACIKIAGSACVIESARTLDEIRLLEKYRPKVLSLFEGEGNKREEVFRVGVAGQGTGSINTYGATFGAQTSAEGKATITMMIPDGTGDVKKWAMDKIGVSILNLNKVEAQFEEAIVSVVAEHDEIENTIVIM